MQKHFYGFVTVGEWRLRRLPRAIRHYEAALAIPPPMSHECSSRLGIQSERARKLACLITSYVPTRRWYSINSVTNGMQYLLANGEMNNPTKNQNEVAVSTGNTRAHMYTNTRGSVTCNRASVYMLEQSRMWLVHGSAIKSTTASAWQMGK